MSPRILVVGASSAIGSAIAEEFARRGRDLALAGRSRAGVERVAGDLEVRYGVRASAHYFEATDFASHGALLRDAEEAGGLEGVVCSFGVMSPQEQAEADFDAARTMIDVNYSATVSVLQLAVPFLAERGEGFLCAISSVAGDRGRQSNFLYGSTKAAVSTYLQGLRNRLYGSGVHVLTVKPGFVDTPMTHGLLNPDSPLTATPDRVARDVVRAIERRRDVVYTPGFWRWVMAVIRMIPERLFKRLSL